MGGVPADSADISIHTPRVGRDVPALYIRTSNFIFQSTRPVWGVTAAGYYKVSTDCEFQSTRPVWGVTAKIHKFLCVFLRKQTKNFNFLKGKPFQITFLWEFIKEILKYGVRSHPGIYVYLCFALHNHRVLRHIRRFTAKMLYLLLILFSQIIKS